MTPDGLLLGGILSAFFAGLIAMLGFALRKSVDLSKLVALQEAGERQLQRIEADIKELRGETKDLRSELATFREHVAKHYMLIQDNTRTFSLLDKKIDDQGKRLTRHIASTKPAP